MNKVLISEVKPSKPKRRHYRQKKMHLDWNGREHLRAELELATQLVVDESDKLAYLNNRDYVNGTVNAMKGFPCNPLFDEIGKAYRNLNELTSRLVNEESIHIDLIRTITGPMMSRGNQAEMNLVQEGLRRAKLANK